MLSLSQKRTMEWVSDERSAIFIGLKSIARLRGTLQQRFHRRRSRVREQRPPAGNRNAGQKQTHYNNKGTLMATPRYGTLLFGNNTTTGSF